MSWMPLTTRVPQNGGVGHRVVGGDVGADGALLGRSSTSTGGGPWHPALLELGQGGAGHAALDGDQGVHQPQALEGVAGVADLALVDLVQVLLDVGAGQGGAAEDDREVGGQPRWLSSSRFSFMITVDFTSRPDMPMTSARCSCGGVQDRGDRLLDAEVDDVVAVVGQDDVDEVLADVVDVAADGGQHDGALALVVGLLHVRLQVGHRGLHDLGGLQHERQLHLAGAEQLADDLHAVQQGVVDDVEGGAVLRAPRRGRPPGRSSRRR